MQLIDLKSKNFLCKKMMTKGITRDERRVIVRIHSFDNKNFKLGGY